MLYFFLATNQVYPRDASKRRAQCGLDLHSLAPAPHKTRVAIVTIFPLYQHVFEVLVSHYHCGPYRLRQSITISHRQSDSIDLPIQPCI